jgi:4-hydroxybenzoate polyprenyltransferase
MIQSQLFIRTREWWDHKIPLTLLLLFLLVSGRPFSASVLFACACLILVVSAVANYGHAINELFDCDQDAKACRTNIATTQGSMHVWAVAFLSAVIALAAAYLAAGAPATLLTFGSLCLPTAYSVPPVRLKERAWLGVFADAIAAHVFPVAMALLVSAQWSLSHITPSMITASLVWSFMLGVRGILSHQVTSEFADQKAGLETVVHTFGATFIARLVLCIALPIEVLAFATIVFLVAPGASFYLIIAAFLLLEGGYVLKGAKRFSFTSDAFFTFPFLCSAFYQVWASTASLVALTFFDARFALILPMYLLLFWARFNQEMKSAAIFRIDRIDADYEEQIAADVSLLRQPGGVDVRWYASCYPDIAKTGLDAVEHYCRIGWREGRHPNPSFATIEYLRRNVDVAVSGMNPLAHFLRHGQFEGRTALPPLYAQSAAPRRR